MPINADYTDQRIRLVIAKNLKALDKKGNTKVTVLKDISLSPMYRFTKGYEG